MRNRACGPGHLGATECNQRTCGPGCQASRTVLRSGATVPENFQTDRCHNVATALRNINNGNHQTYSQGRSLHHPSCNCGNCSKGRHPPETTFKDLLYRQSVGVGASATRLRSSQSHTHSQQNPYDRHCSGVGPSFYQGQQSADTLIERLRSSSRSSVFSASRDFEPRNASACAGFMSHAAFETKANESSSSSLHTTSKANFPCPEGVPLRALTKQISLHGWYLMKPTGGDKTSGCLPLPGVAIGGYRSRQMLQTEILQTARVEKRLEMSKLRTSDGLEVVLVGMIDLNKSIANGFSPELVKHFIMGFPSRWIYMMLNLSSRRSTLDLPSSPVQQDMDNFAVQSRDPPVEANPVLCSPTAPFFTPPSEGTWREALRSFSLTTRSSLPYGSSDVNTSEQCGLDQEQSKGQRTCCEAHRSADPQGESSCLERKTSSLTGELSPRTGAEAIAVENTDKFADGSSQTGSPPHPGLQGDVAGKVSKDPDRTVSQKSLAAKDVPALTPVSSLGEEVKEVFQCMNYAPETEAVSDCPNSAVACCDGLQNMATDEGRGAVDAEELTRNTEGVDHGHGETELPSVQVPFTPLQTSRQLMADLNKQNTKISTRGTNPDKNLQNMQTGRKLRSGKCLLVVVDKQMKERGIVHEDGIENNNTRKRQTKCKMLCSEGCKDVMQSREPISSTEDLPVHHEDAVELGGMDQAPSTPSPKATRPVNVSPGSVVVDTPTTDAEIHPLTNPQPADNSKKLRSGRRLRPLDKPIQVPVAGIPTVVAETHPVANLQDTDDKKKLRSGRPTRALEKLVVNPVSARHDLKSRKKRRILPSDAPVAQCDDDHSIDCEVQDTKVDEESVGFEEQDTKVDELQGHEGGTEVSSRPTEDESLTESAIVNRRVNKRRHGKLSKIYRSRKKKSCPDSFPTIKLELQSPRSDSCNSRRKILKVGVEKSFQMEETKPTTRSNSANIHQSSKTTGREILLLSGDPLVPTRSTRVPSRSRSSGKKRVQAPNRATSSCTNQAKKEVQSGKRNSIVPPPLPAPRVAEASKVVEAYGLKKSRFGRIIVPPLAAWCNQSIIYDKDGSIIAISDASPSKVESETGCFNFTFPSDTGARKMRTKLLKAAQTNWSQK